ncbi:MAG: transglycosylase SLT domain-containing protein [Rhodobacteraceae bacterium]|nr:transglycosylase SLT domain-containing protein [Paracoccaceae bacterium]
MTLTRSILCAALAATLTVSACGGRKDETSRGGSTSSSSLPVMRWDHRPEAAEWTSATLAALRSHGSALPQIVPYDIAEWCPAYPSASLREREAFWAGLFSALAKHESTWRPEAAGGGGRWIGLLQIAPATAEGYDCRATSPRQLKDGSANLSCGVRIAAHQVVRDNAVMDDGSGNWRGMARDWAPFRSESKRADMAAWTRSQSYCRR